MAQETLTVDNLTFEVRRSGRRRTLALVVGRRGELRVHAPTRVALSVLESWVRTKLPWVQGKLMLRDEQPAHRPPPQFLPGENFSFLGRPYPLQLVESQREALRLEGNAFLLRHTAREKAENHFRSWYRRLGQPWLETRVGELRSCVGVAPTRIVVRHLGYRWGSCRSDGLLSFHWKLLQLPPHLVDYVIFHELAHLIEPNHGKGFKALMERILPPWREREKEFMEAARAAKF